MVSLVGWPDLDPGGLKKTVDDCARTGAVFDTVTKRSPVRSLGPMDLIAARRWLLGKTTIKVSLTRTRHANSVTPRCRRRKAVSIFLSKGPLPRRSNENCGTDDK